MTQCRVDSEKYIGSLPHPLWALALKRFLDIAISLVLIILVSPIFILISLAISLLSPGPVFYRGIRSGLGGKPFRIFKFRTMVKDAESLGGPTTGSNDIRVTPVGRYLRRSKLDELPQLINVLLGDMSLVGPRPEVLKYTNLYQGEENLILSMKPGMTDYSSIEFADLDDRVGNDNPDDFFKQCILPQKNKLRIRYVKEWSIVSDFIILLLTFKRVLHRIFSK